MFILRRISIFALLIFLFLELIILVITLDFFQVKKIVTPSYFSPLLYEQGGKNLLRFDVVAFTKEIKEDNPKIKNVTLKKKFPSTFILQFEIREPLFKAADRDQQALFLVDETGVVFATARENMYFPLVVTGRISLKEGIILDDPAEKTALEIVNLIQETDLKLDKLIIEEKQILAMFDSIEVVFKTEDVDSEKLKALQFLVKRFTIEGKKPKKIDLRFDKPIVKF